MPHYTKSPTILPPDLDIDGNQQTLPVNTRSMFFIPFRLMFGSSLRWIVLMAVLGVVGSWFWPLIDDFVMAWIFEQVHTSIFDLPPEMF
ncbi:hypothetical protein [Thalassoglobus sp.]|uniref:hypothetical protein n=1 Tax=Thalassoglobus sp. TaxID=2795869 RepID=UPI003AA9079D